jgi:hypothetical protein
MSFILVKSHVLIRWKERILEKPHIKKEDIVRMIKRGYKVIEPGREGRTIIESSGYVFVVTKTNKSMIVHTVYCKVEDYDTKCDHIENVSETHQIARWEKQQQIRQSNKRRCFC